MTELNPGLYVIATPIGHMDDLSPHARQVLTRADLICAEDTRQYRHLLQLAQISPVSQKVIAMHAHNEATQTVRVLQALSEGKLVGLVSDAGTPGIADPGQRLTDAAWSHGFAVFPIAGPSALTAALSVCGFAPQEGRPWSFWGFLPARRPARLKQLQAIADTGGVCLVFASPHRLDESLEDCITVLGEQTPTLLAKELTKKFEALWRGSLGDISRNRADRAALDPQTRKGEYVIVFSVHKTAPYPATETISGDWAPWLSAVRQALPKSEAARIVSAATGLTRQQAYSLLISPNNAEGQDS
ncbi:MAG: 16S rRNA (cytidine(1402)-2'-O)-methyltransferase [Burkholderiaceae bacterium]